MRIFIQSLVCQALEEVEQGEKRLQGGDGDQSTDMTGLLGVVEVVEGKD